MTAKGGWGRFGVVIAAVAVTVPVMALLTPFEAPPGERFFGAIVGLVAYGWWLYLPGMVAYTLALPPLVRHASIPERAVAVLASPMIMAVPLLGLVALVVFGSPAPRDAPQADIAGLLASVFVPAVVAGAVVPLPER